ncbi:MAG: HEAT repeat domain-containing protein, partial [Gemmatimonadota bacterium]
WEPLLLQVLSGERPERELQALVARKGSRYFVNFLLRYARQLRGPQKDTVLRLAASHLDVLLVDLRARSPERRAYALKSLGALSVTSYRDQFLEALTDPSLLVAMNAAQALARNYDVSFADRLLHSLERFDGWSLRYLAAMLASMGSESVEILRQAFRDTRRSSRVRAAIAMTLTTLNDILAVQTAAQVLETESNTDLIVAALGLIDRVGGPDQLSAVRRLLSSSDPAIRARAVTALARIGSSQDVRHLQAALDDSNNWVVIHAVEGLLEMGRKDILEAVAGSDHPRALAAREVLWEGAPDA